MSQKYALKVSNEIETLDFRKKWNDWFDGISSFIFFYDRISFILVLCLRFEVEYQIGMNIRKIWLENLDEFEPLSIICSAESITKIEIIHQKIYGRFLWTYTIKIFDKSSSVFWKHIRSKKEEMSPKIMFS